MPAKSIILWQNNVNKSIHIFNIEADHFDWNGEMLCLFFLFFFIFFMWHLACRFWLICFIDNERSTQYGIFMLFFSIQTELMIKTETKTCDTVCMSSR